MYLTSSVNMLNSARSSSLNLDLTRKLSYSGLNQKKQKISGVVAIVTSESLNKPKLLFVYFIIRISTVHLSIGLLT
jgi:hypothetical protein